MYENIGSVIFNFFDRVIILISNPPVIYLFYTILFLWLINLFFRIVRS